MNIRDHVFLVTGAGSGLGAATARRFAQGGARIVLLDLNRAGG
ncbi:MAG: SDR family NAD(P)-dependent oxidoreductase, partial [Burkholderiales bacterium]